MDKLIYENPDQCVSATIDKIGNKIVIAVPLGFGKPIQFLNALYNQAKKNPNIQLKIITALSLVKPKVTNELAKRFAEPIISRLYHGYMDLDYELDRRAQKLPDNVQITEFYLAPGKYINNNTVQQDYICSNYTNVIRDMLRYKINVIAQLISAHHKDTNRFSLSCNTDLTLDLVKAVENSKYLDHKPLYIGEINRNLPYMYGESAEINKDKMDAIIDSGHSAKLFVIPRPAISEQDFMIGLYGSTLIKDDGCLQIGIGRLSDALTYSLILRHKKNKEYINLLKHIQVKEKFGDITENVGETSVFKKGLFASTEMLVDGFLDLYDNEILIRKVYDDVTLQKSVNENQITEKVTEKTIDLLLENKRISPRLTSEDFDYLQYYGIFKDKKHLQYKDGYIYFSPKKKVFADLAKDKIKTIIINQCLGDKLKNGRVAHAGIFIGAQGLYDYLSNLSEEDRRNFDMRGIEKINQLFKNESIDILQRKNARFVNSSMKVTLLGSIISDTLENAKVISGVGGQYNFVAMAHELDGARSIINCNSTYTKNGKVSSNIVWEYGVTTIPRHLRDIVITEYGIADCRSKTDCEVIQAILNITDSRFQDKLLNKAKKYGKVPHDYQIPQQYTNNYPETIIKFIKSYHNHTVYQRYPFGTQLSHEEVRIEKVLNYLESLSRTQHILLFFKGIFLSSKPYKNLLKRMNLEKPKSFKAYIYHALLVATSHHCIRSIVRL